MPPVAARLSVSLANSARGAQLRSFHAPGESYRAPTLRQGRLQSASALVAAAAAAAAVAATCWYARHDASMTGCATFLHSFRVPHRLSHPACAQLKLCCQPAAARNAAWSPPPPWPLLAYLPFSSRPSSRGWAA
jgi:hypothetical protein